MPSINTGGFQATVMPGIQYLPPQQFVPNYGDTIPNISIGAKAYSQLTSIAEEARMRPIKQRMAEIALAQGETNLANMPLDTQIKRQNLGQMQIQNDLGREVIESVTPLDESTFEEDFTPGVDQAPDDLLSPAPDGTWAKRKVYGDLYEVERGYRILPNGVKVPFERKKLKEDAATRDQKAKVIEINEAYRTGMINNAAERNDISRDRISSTGAKLKWLRDVMIGGKPHSSYFNPETGDIEHKPYGDGAEIVEPPITAAIRSAMNPQQDTGIQLPNVAASATTAPAAGIDGNLGSRAMGIMPQVAAVPAVDAPIPQGTYKTNMDVAAALKAGKITRKQAEDYLAAFFDWSGKK